MTDEQAIDATARAILELREVGKRGGYAYLRARLAEIEVLYAASTVGVRPSQVDARIAAIEMEENE